MKIAALVIGVIGGVFGIIAAVLALTIGGIGTAVGAEGASMVTGLGWLALLFCVIGFLGAGLAMAKPVLGAVLLIVSAVGITISISYFAIASAPLFLIAGILAFFGRKAGSVVHSGAI